MFNTYMYTCVNIKFAIFMDEFKWLKITTKSSTFFQRSGEFCIIKIQVLMTNRTLNNISVFIYHGEAKMIVGSIYPLFSQYKYITFKHTYRV